jgi:SagB-type dehydrogenase family enzyme
MNREVWVVVSLVLMMLLSLSGGCGQSNGGQPVSDGSIIILPEPAHDGNTSVEEALLARRSVRSYQEAALTLEEISQLVWAAQGITDPSGKRTAPSAGALYPLEVYVVAGNVEGVTPGVYRYRPDSHTLVEVLGGDQREALSQAALGQSCVREGAVDIVITAVYARTTEKYGERGITYVHIEAGHAAQNICLQGVALKLGAVTVGAFDDGSVKKVLGLPDDEEPLYILPVGRTGD